MKPNCHFSSSFYYLRRGTRWTVNKIPASRAAANPAPETSNRTGAHVGAAQTHLPHQELNEVSVTNSEVERAMNHQQLKEDMRTPALIEPEFTALSNVGTYILAARDGLTGVARLFSKYIHV